MMAKPMKTLELHYPMIQFLIISYTDISYISCIYLAQASSFDKQQIKQSGLTNRNYYLWIAKHYRDKQFFRPRPQQPEDI